MSHPPRRRRRVPCPPSLPRPLTTVRLALTLQLSRTERRPLPEIQAHPKRHCHWPRQWLQWPASRSRRWPTPGPLRPAPRRPPRLISRRPSTYPNHLPRVPLSRRPMIRHLLQRRQRRTSRHLPPQQTREPHRQTREPHRQTREPHRQTREPRRQPREPQRQTRKQGLNSHPSRTPGRTQSSHPHRNPKTTAPRRSPVADAH